MMSVWLLYKYVDYEGPVEYTIEVFSSRQKAEQERDNRNYLRSSLAVELGVSWCVLERDVL